MANETRTTQCATALGPEAQHNQAVAAACCCTCRCSCRCMYATVCPEKSAEPPETSAEKATGKCTGNLVMRYSLHQALDDDRHGQSPTLQSTTAVQRAVHRSVKAGPG